MGGAQPIILAIFSVNCMKLKKKLDSVSLTTPTPPHLDLPMHFYTLALAFKLSELLAVKYILFYHATHILNITKVLVSNK